MKNPHSPGDGLHPLPPAVNFHLWKPCDLRCTFCYAEFDDDALLKTVRGGLPKDDCHRILIELRAAGAEKLTFVGGEPTLCPFLPQLLRHARVLGFVTSLVTNGSRLAEVLAAAPGCLDWVGLSVDSPNELIQVQLGRGKGDHVARSIKHFSHLHALDIHVKLNTVVTALNWTDDFTDFILLTKPERWKVFQVLPVAGQNTGRVEPLLITPDQFSSFVERNRHLASRGTTIAAETNDDMTGSYAMIDPAGRFFSNSSGQHSYSRPILEVGVSSAFNDILFDAEKFVSRGGIFPWDRPADVNLTINSRPIYPTGTPHPMTGP